jgi:transcriptional regulator with XRE-family HTH domain
MSELFDKALSQVSGDIKRFVGHSVNLVNEIANLLDDKKMSRKDLADLLGKKESEISKWMSGTHNMTLKTISKIEDVLDEEIILTSSEAKKKYAEVGIIRPFQLEISKTSSSTLNSKGNFRKVKNIKKGESFPYREEGIKAA